MSNTQIANKPKTIREWLTSDKLKGQIAESLPNKKSTDRFLRVMMTSMQKTPKLMECTQASLYQAFITCSQLGIEPDGRRAHLIPYGKTCQLIIDYKGLVELVMRSGKVRHIHADVVCEKDDFEYDRGQVIKHRINLKEPRGDVYAVYAICQFVDGAEKADVMTKEEVEAVRKASKAGTSGPWKDHWNEMAKKTVFRRLSKWLPLSPEVMEKIEKDDIQYEFERPIKQAQKADMGYDIPEVEDTPPEDEGPQEHEEETQPELGTETEGDPSDEKSF